MRKCLTALLLVTLGGCDEASLELTATIGTLSFAADPAVPDGLATIDLTADLEARNGAAEITLERVTAFALPRNDDAAVGVGGVLMNPQGQGNDIVRLDSGELVTVRVTNGDVLNSVVGAWCGRPAEVELEFADGSVTAEDSAEATVLCP